MFKIIPNFFSLQQEITPPPSREKSWTNTVMYYSNVTTKFYLITLRYSLNALPRISGVNLTLVFPVGLSIFDVEYIGVYSDNQARNLIYVPTSLNVPANV